MSRTKILTYPDQRLRKVAAPVIDINKNIHSIIHKMFDVMYSNQGIGLAATQINIHKQIIVIDIWNNNLKNRLVCINPKILNKSGTTGIVEGCLSIPNKYSFISRSKKIKIHTLNQHGHSIEIEADDLLSICIQHEIDHLVGKLFIDYLPNENQSTKINS